MHCLARGAGLSGPCTYLARWVGPGFGCHAGTWHGGSGCRAPCGRLARGSGCSDSGCSPGSVSPGCRAPSGCLARWFGLFRRARVPPTCWSGQAALGCRRAVGCRRCGGVAVSWPSGPRVQLPAALMDRPVVGSAQQGEVGQVGGAAMEPVAEVVGFAPGQGPLAVGEDTAAVAHGQGGALGGVDDSGGPPDLQGLGGGASQGRGQQPSWRPGAARPGPGSGSGPGWGCQVGLDAGVAGRRWWPWRWWLGAGGSPALGSPPRHRPVAGTPRGPAARPSRPRPRPHGGGRGGCPGPRSPSAGAGPHRSGGAGRPPGGGGPARPGHQRCVGCRCGCRWRRPGGPTVPGRPTGSGRPRVPAAHPRPPCRQRSGPATTPGGHGGAPGPGRRRRGRPPGAGGPGAAAADLGPAAGPPRPAPVRPRR